MARVVAASGCSAIAEVKVEGKLLGHVIFERFLSVDPISLADHAAQGVMVVNTVLNCGFTT